MIYRAAKKSGKIFAGHRGFFQGGINSGVEARSSLYQSFMVGDARGTGRGLRATPGVGLGVVAPRRTLRVCRSAKGTRDLSKVKPPLSTRVFIRGASRGARGLLKRISISAPFYRERTALRSALTCVHSRVRDSPSLSAYVTFRPRDRNHENPFPRGGHGYFCALRASIRNTFAGI